MRLSGGKVAPKLAELWKQLTEEKRNEYKDNYQAAMEKYKEDLDAYKQTEEYQQYQNGGEADDGDEFIPESEEEIDEEEYNYEEIVDDEEEEEIEDSAEESEEEEGLDWEELESQTRREEALERARKREERRQEQRELQTSGGYVNYQKEDQWQVSTEDRYPSGFDEHGHQFHPQKRRRIE